MVEPDASSVRARGRQLALLTLCHLESYPSEERRDAVDVLWSSPPDSPELAELVEDKAAVASARRFLATVNDNLVELDEIIERTSERWRVARMDQVDRNLLRLATAELAHDEETPRAVVLAEAVRLAQRYGGERSVTFVNGVCSSLAGELRPAPAREGGARG